MVLELFSTSIFPGFWEVKLKFCLNSSREERVWYSFGCLLLTHLNFKHPKLISLTIPNILVFPELFFTSRFRSYERPNFGCVSSPKRKWIVPSIVNLMLCSDLFLFSQCTFYGGCKTPKKNKNKCS